MKTAIRGVLANLVWIGILAGSQAAAQQESPRTGQGTPAEARLRAEQLTPEPEAAGSTQPASTPSLSLDQVQSYQQGETNWLDDGTGGECPAGPCCAVCGGGSCCPPQWYTEHGVSILTRGKPRRTPLTSRFEIQEIDAQLIGGSAGDLVNFRFVRPFIMTTRSVGFDIAPGYSVTVGRYLGRDTENRDHFVEFEYTGMHDWVEPRTVVGGLEPVFENDDPFDPANPPAIIGYTGSLMSPFPEFDNEVFREDADFDAVDIIRALDKSFNNVERHSMEYRSKMDNFELNGRIRPRARSDRLVLHPNGRWRRECQPGHYVSYLFGLRLISIDEDFGFLSHGTTYEAEVSPVSPPPAHPAFVYDGSYEIRTHNDLLGLQFGGDYIYRRCKWTLGMRAKMGPFVNLMDQTSRIIADQTDLSPEFPYDPVRQIRRADISAAARKNGASLVGEFGFVGTYKLYPNLTLRGAYDFMWITGLALAPEQLIFQPDAVVSPAAIGRVNDNGHGYFHGLTLSAEYAW